MPKVSGNKILYHLMYLPDQNQMIKEFDLNNNVEGVSTKEEFYKLLNKWNRLGGVFWKYWH